jgi:CO/xanthine dehydrogenase FAD-binding subunit
MRGNADAHQLIAPGTLDAVLSLMADEPGEWAPFAGGTELMVMHSVGRLRAKKLVSLGNLGELRFLHDEPEWFSIGAGTTFRELRASQKLAVEFPLLAESASWIGTIANQSRATIGGNIVNGSPAADSPPALLVYDAEIEMISTRGSRRVPYSEFHTGYKENVLAKDELLYAVHLPKRFAGYKQYLRKVGTRRALAISKVAMAAIAKIEGGVMREVRVAAASLAPYPARMLKTEAALEGAQLNEATIAAARKALLGEAQPIDDIRSTAEYRREVAANLVEEFLRKWKAEKLSEDGA